MNFITNSFKFGASAGAETSRSTSNKGQSNNKKKTTKKLNKLKAQQLDTQQYHRHHHFRNLPTASSAGATPQNNGLEQQQHEQARRRSSASSSSLAGASTASPASLLSQILARNQLAQGSSSSSHGSNCLQTSLDPNNNTNMSFVATTTSSKPARKSRKSGDQKQQQMQLQQQLVGQHHYAIDPSQQQALTVGYQVSSTFGHRQLGSAPIVGGGALNNNNSNNKGEDQRRIRPTTTAFGELATTGDVDRDLDDVDDAIELTFELDDAELEGSASLRESRRHLIDGGGCCVFEAAALVGHDDCADSDAMIGQRQQKTTTTTRHDQSIISRRLNGGAHHKCTGFTYDPRSQLEHLHQHWRQQQPTADDNAASNFHVTSRSSSSNRLKLLATNQHHYHQADQEQDERNELDRASSTNGPDSIGHLSSSSYVINANKQLKQQLNYQPPSATIDHKHSNLIHQHHQKLHQYRQQQHQQHLQHQLQSLNFPISANNNNNNLHQSQYFNVLNDFNDNQQQFIIRHNNDNLVLTAKPKQLDTNQQLFVTNNSNMQSSRQHLTSPDLHRHHLHQTPKRKPTGSNQQLASSGSVTPTGRQYLGSSNANIKLIPRSLSNNVNLSAASNNNNSNNMNQGQSLQIPLQQQQQQQHRAPLALSCCGKFAKFLLFISNALFWLAGLALGAWGILALVDDHKYNISQLLVFEPNSRMSLFQLLSWSFITLGCATILVGFCGCSALFKNNRWILGLYIFLILAIFALDLATGLLAIIFQERLVANVRLRLVNKLRNEYGVQASFTAAIDFIQTKYECCGLDGHLDYDQSLWRLQRLGGFEATVARTCCHLRNTFDDQAHVNPRPINETMCQSPDVRFNQSYRYRRGCLDDLERLIRHKIWTFTIGCGAVGAVILISLVFATCFCRAIPSNNNNGSRKGSTSNSNGRRQRQQQQVAVLSYIDHVTNQKATAASGHYR